MPWIELKGLCQYNDVLFLASVIAKANLIDRISYGGTQASEYMLKLMQLKYPTFPTKVTASQAQVCQLVMCIVV